MEILVFSWNTKFEVLREDRRVGYYCPALLFELTLCVSIHLVWLHHAHRKALWDSPTEPPAPQLNVHLSLIEPNCLNVQALTIDERWYHWILGVVSRECERPRSNRCSIMNQSKLFTSSFASTPSLTHTLSLMSSELALPSIPVIDLSAPRSEIVALLRLACSNVGFFYLRGFEHLLRAEQTEALFAAMHEFFALPLELKRTVYQDANNRGYTPFQEEILDPANQVVGDTKEGYYIGIDVPEGHADHGKPLRGPNQWPDESLTHLVAWRHRVSSYFDAVTRVARSLMGLVAEALGLPDGFFEAPGVTDNPISLLRLLHYAAIESVPDEGVFACGAHSDYGVLTLLATDHNPGLQIFLRDRHRQRWLAGISNPATFTLEDAARELSASLVDDSAGQWIDVPPMPNALIVNLGDCLERWTNGVFISTRHRVLTPPNGAERYSAPFFFEPNFDCLIECLPQCCSDSRPAKYPPIAYGEYLMYKYRTTHQGYQG